MDKTVALYSLGCKINSYDTQRIRESFLLSGYKEVDFNEPADVYVVNTCTVTHLGDRKSRQILRRAKRTNPEAVVIATGCYAQTDRQALEKIDEVDLVIPPDESLRIPEILDGTGLESEGITFSKDKNRAFVKIQDGCNQFCTYCIVPYARGHIRSKEKEVALEEIKILIENGFEEVILSGIHIASYGKDLKEDDLLIELIEDLKDSGLKRLRLSSLEPRLITRDFLERLKEVKIFCPHFHLSLQSGSDSVLKRMNRHYSSDEYLEKVKLIREFYPLAGITTDIIVGFPGESEEEFLQTMELAEKADFSKIHIFPYSKREGTPASRMKDQVNPETVRKRIKKLEDLERKSRLAFYEKQLGTEAEVLFETEKDGIYHGYTKNYIPVYTKSEKDLTGKIVRVKLNSINNDQVETELVGKEN